MSSLARGFVVLILFCQGQEKLVNKFEENRKMIPRFQH